MKVEEFNNLTGDMDMAEVIRRAGPAYPPRKQARPGAASIVGKLDYSTLENAGKPHRGKTTDAEKDIIPSQRASEVWGFMILTGKHTSGRLDRDRDKRSDEAAAHTRWSHVRQPPSVEATNFHCSILALLGNAAGCPPVDELRLGRSP
jgi:hypothetical protein